MKILFLSLFIACTFSLKAQTNDEIIAMLKKELPQDENFKLNALIDRKIFNIGNDTISIPLSDEHYATLAQLTSQAKTIEELLNIWTSYKVEKPEEILNLLQEKIVALDKVVKKFPDLGKLSQDELIQVLTYSYSQLSLESQEQLTRYGCPNICCEDYVEAIDDCDTDFAIGTAASIVGGLLGGFFGSPLVGAGIITAGIGTAWAYLERCTRTAVRDYKRCMGYIR